MADNEIKVNGQTLTARPGVLSPSPTRELTGDRFPLAYVTEAHAAKKSAQGRRGHYIVGKKRFGRTGTKQIAIIDRVGPGQHRDTR